MDWKIIRVSVEVVGHPNEVERLRGEIWEGAREGLHCVRPVLESITGTERRVVFSVPAGDVVFMVVGLVRALWRKGAA